MSDKQFIKSFATMRERAAETTRGRGLSDPKTTHCKHLTALVNEVSEFGDALDAQMANPPMKWIQSEKIPGFRHMEEELADVVLTCMTIADFYAINLAKAIVAKNEYNQTRSD